MKFFKLDAPLTFATISSIKIVFTAAPASDAHYSKLSFTSINKWALVCDS